MTTADNGGARARTPARLSAAAWWSVVRRTVAEFRRDNLTDWAAALTYYAVLSIFPALVALVSIIGLVGHSATDALLKNLNAFAPGPAKQILSTSLHDLAENRSGAGVVFVLGLAGALWAASGYVAGFMRAANVIWDVEEGRPIWKTLPVRVGITMFTVVALAIGAVAVIVTGPVARRAGDLLGLGSAAVTAWDIAKWPVLVLLLALLLAILYYAAPNVRQPGLAWVSPGGLLAILLWIAASGLFAIYVATFGSYNKTYGALAGIIAFLVWLWISNIAILLGAEFDAELARERQIQAGHPADKEPFLPTRDPT